jgi:starch-binding outer membrane protein, SusD/RagB family
MNRLYRYLLAVPLLASASACDHLTTEPQTVLTDEQVWRDPRLIRAVLADYYNRLPKHTDFGGAYVCGSSTAYCGWKDYTSYDEAIWSGVGNFDFEFRNSLITYPYGRWSLWNYDLIRDINLAIANIENTTAPTLSATQKEQFIAELRFLRAFNYFLLVMRMGGVPIITELLVYDFGGDPSYLQRPRNTEAEVYDFIASELDAIADQLGNVDSKTRANRYTALALKSRAMLYAGSLARHNTESTSPISLTGGEVGIPAARAEEYYTKSLDASRQLITSGSYSLQRGNPHPGENFYEAVSKKTVNTEVILAIDYLASQGRSHRFTMEIIPRSLRVDVADVSGGSAISPSLNLVEAFDYLDGSPGTLRGVGTGSNTAAGQADWIFYDNPADIFANKDPRLYGTIIYPGTAVAGKPVTIQAGVYVWNANTNKYDRTEGTRNSTYTDGGILTGADGPARNENYLSATGFYLRKYFDPSPSAATSAVESDMWWIWFRLGEVYLNAAEAAFELGLHGEALGYVNTLRERAGFPPNSLPSLTRAKIRNERRVELAFEDHRVWDLKRWRIAHELWDGTRSNPDANVYALFPYRIVRPDHPNHGKYVFDRFMSDRQTTPRHFRVGNYYSEIPQSVLDNNPKIVRNPFH